MRFDDIVIDIQISVGQSSQVFRARRVLSENQLPMDFEPIDFPIGVEDDIYCTPEKSRKKILKFREDISKILAEEIMNFFERYDTLGGYKE